QVRRSHAADRARKAAGRSAVERRARVQSPAGRSRMLLRRAQPAAQMGTRAGDDSLRPITGREESAMTLLEAMRQRPLLGDGAMGTQLMIAGLEQGNCGEEWNLTHPERVLAIQRRYAESGSDCILTNTFGGSRIMLNRHGNSGKV